MTQHIVVHPGNAHLDEILATGLICHARGVLPVVRQAPTDAELDDPEVWVVDVGMRHEPALRNFDHHQLDSEREPECAMSLVARHLGLHDTLSTRPWYPAQVRIDIEGATRFARDFGLSRGIPAPLESPLDTAILRLWAAGGVGPVDEAVVRLVTRLTEALVDEAVAFEPDLEACRAITEVRRIEGVPVIFHDGAAGEAVSNYLRDEWQEAHGEFIALSVSSDPRPPHGLAVYRFFDDPRVDLFRLEGDERVIYAHPHGFVAKIRRPVQGRELEELLRRALTST